MQRTIEQLNEMSFDLPKTWQVTDEVYSLPNGQGMTNIENYVSSQGEVISLFVVQRDPNDFFTYYDSLIAKYPTLTQKYQLAGKFQLKVGEFVLPTYIIKGMQDKLFTTQIFVNCGDCLACFMFGLSSFDGNIKNTIKSEHILQEVIKILRSVE